jgi:hypothetical protein
VRAEDEVVEVRPRPALGADGGLEGGAPHQYGVETLLEVDETERFGAPVGIRDLNGPASGVVT